VSRIWCGFKLRSVIIYEFVKILGRSLFIEIILESLDWPFIQNVASRTEFISICISTDHEVFSSAEVLGDLRLDEKIRFQDIVLILQLYKKLF